MSESAEMISNSASNAVTAKTVTVATTGTAAAAGSSAPTHLYGEFLTSHGFWVLSYAEWMQVLGSIYVFILVCKTVVIPVISKLKGLLRNEKASKINIKVRSKP